MSDVDYGFRPILGSDPAVLVLGTLPSRSSLDLQQYYAHPQNAFWWLMGELFDFDYKIEYARRANFIANHRVAVWDVIKSGVRPGSMDADIQRDTVLVNDFSALFEQYPGIEALAFNGKAAYQLYRRQVLGSGKYSDTRQHLVMPSTSPANAAMSREEKLQHWQGLLAFL